MRCAPCVARLGTPQDRLAAIRTAIGRESEPLVTLTHLLRLCRDEHSVLWEQVSDPDARVRVTAVLAQLAEVVPAATSVPVLNPAVRHVLADSLEPADGVPPVVVAYALAQFVDQHFGHTFAESFRRRSPYQPAVGDPIPLDSPDLRKILAMRSTSPPWRLANRLDETRHVRLAGEWAVQFRVVFDYSLIDTLTGLIDADTVVATCHPNRGLRELDLSRGQDHRTFPIVPVDPAAQRAEIDRLIARAATAGASVVVFPELCLTEAVALELHEWVRRPGGPRILVAGSYHHQDEHGQDPLPGRRRNTALAWVRGHDVPLTHDKHSPADRPVIEDIQPQGWPELRVYVTSDGWHLVIAICRDLLNPHAVHALAEAGANLVLVPAMSETLMTFGGPVAHLVGAGQALVAVANNPGQWSDDHDGVAGQPARALLGHPGLGQQVRLVHSPDPEPGVALLTVRSAEIAWLPGDRPGAGPGHPKAATSARPGEPAWLRVLADQTRPPGPLERRWPERVSLRRAAVLVLLTDGLNDGPAGPRVLLTERSADLEHYPGRLVFPGGAADPGDDGPVATALREAREETGLDPDTVDVIGVLPPLALPDSGFLVHPVLAWSARPEFPRSINYAEVAALHEMPLRDLAARPDSGLTGTSGEPTRRAQGPDPSTLGTMTVTVINEVIDLLTGTAQVPRIAGVARSRPRADVAAPPRPWR